MPNRVAIIGTRGYPSYYGGFETAVRRLAPHFIEAGWQVIVYSRPGQTKVSDPQRNDQVQVVETWGLKRASLSTLTYGLTACLHALFNKPDVALVMNCANGFWLPLLRLRGIPVLVNVDGIEWEREKWGPLAKAIFRLGARCTAWFANEIVVDARAIGERWCQEFGRDSLYIPYGGSRPSQLPLLEPGLKSAEYVLLVARFVPENTVQEFFQAARRLADNYDIVLVGNGGPGSPLNTEAEDLSRHHPRIRWLGQVSDDRRLFSLWQHAGVYFHGHSVGGTNPALVQAMACGANILARDTVFNREVLADAGNYCGSDANSIETAVIDLMKNTERDRRIVINRAERNYDWGDVCDSYMAAVKHLQNRSKGRSTRRQTPRPSSLNET